MGECRLSDQAVPKVVFGVEALSGLIERLHEGSTSPDHAWTRYDDDSPMGDTSWPYNY